MSLPRQIARRGHQANIIEDNFRRPASATGSWGFKASKIVKSCVFAAPSLSTRRETLVTLIEFALRGGMGEDVMQ